jgi:hypothetical protein
MKHIIPLVILFTITCLGQDIKSDVTLKFKPSEWEIISLQQYLKDYQQYETECYADSSKQYYRLEQVWGERDSWRMAKILVDTETAENCKCILPYFYTHREPTFTGFMEWLKKKYGKG